MKRLTSGTLFEAEGWKRILGAVKLMESFKLDPAKYELRAERVFHPNSAINRPFLEKIRGMEGIVTDVDQWPKEEIVFEERKKSLFNKSSKGSRSFDVSKKFPRKSYKYRS